MSDFEFSEEYGPRRVPGRESPSAFRTMLGGSLGCVVAMLVAFFLCALMCGGCLMIGALNSKPMPNNLHNSRK